MIKSPCCCADVKYEWLGLEYWRVCKKCGNYYKKHGRLVLMDKENLKCCNECGKWKTRLEFYTNNHNIYNDGVDYTCKDCRKQKRKIKNDRDKKFEEFKKRS